MSEIWCTEYDFQMDGNTATISNLKSYVIPDPDSVSVYPAVDVQHGRAITHPERTLPGGVVTTSDPIVALFEEIITAYEFAVDDWVEGHPDRDRMIAMRIAEWHRWLAALVAAGA